jgi:predicted thioesterase
MDYFVKSITYDQTKQKQVDCSINFMFVTQVFATKHKIYWMPTALYAICSQVLPE